MAFLLTVLACLLVGGGGSNGGDTAQPWASSPPGIARKSQFQLGIFLMRQDDCHFCAVSESLPWRCRLLNIRSEEGDMRVKPFCRRKYDDRLSEPVAS